jgi:peptidyl-prolyl cis-trans isomerase SurA
MRTAFVRLCRVLAVTGLVGVAAGGALAADTVIEEIVARVNNQIITRADLRRSREQMQNEARQQGITDMNDSRVQGHEKNLLRDLIDQQLLLQKGQELGITADTDLVKRLDEMRKGMGLNSMEALETEAKKQGVSFEDFKQNMKNNLITQQVIQREVGGRIHITPEEEKKFYDEHKDELAQPEQVRLSEILITPGGPSEEALAAARKKAEEAMAQIKSGKSFEDTALLSSTGPSASQGGDLGFFKRGTLAKDLEDRTFAMKAGEISDVIQTKQGFVILKVSEHQQAGVPPLAQVEPQVQEAIYMDRLQPALREYLAKLREDSFVDVKTGYVDSGASPNQTVPVTVATDKVPTGKAPPKHRKRMGLIPR